MTWKHLAIAAVAGLALGGAGGYFARPQPAVHEQLQVDAAASATSDKTEHRQEGPVDRIWTLYGPRAGAEAPVLPAAPPIPGARTGALRPAAQRQNCAVVAVMREHLGPVTTDIHETKAQAETQRVREELTVTPAARPGWAVQVGIEDLFSLNSLRMAQEIRPALRRRLPLFGRGWAEISTKPLHRCDDGRWCPTAGAALAVEW